MERETVIRTVAEGLRGDPDLRALALGGSLGHGQGDRFSDIDFVGDCPPAAQPALAERWRAVLERVTPLVFVQTRRGPPLLMNVVSREFLRCDLLASESLYGRARRSLRPLLDPDGLIAALPESLPPTPPSGPRVTGLIREFIRILGLLPVGLGRGELVTAVRGAGMLRDLLIDLMLEDIPREDRGGALHLSRVLPPADMELLAALPNRGPRRDEIIEAYCAVAAAFLPRARHRAAALGEDWPAEFEAAALSHLRRELGLDIAEVVARPWPG